MAPHSNYREDIIDVIGVRFEDYLEVHKGKMFGHPGFSIKGRFFCFAYEDGLCLKLSSPDYREILELPEAEKFKPKDSPMGTWAVLTYPEAEEYLDHWDWIEKSMAYIVTDEAAPPKKRKTVELMMQHHTISGDTFRFMLDLWNNNNKEWFDANRKRYEEYVREPLKALAEELSGPVSIILPEFSGRAKISRINNDIRFSPDKPLYKEHMWISFGGGSGGSNADIFAAVDRHGWCAGCGIGADKREPLDHWRKNLLANAEKWEEYMTAIGYGDKVSSFIDQSYKKPLFPDIPDHLYELVQAKSVWLVGKPGKEFRDVPVKEYFNEICKFLPLYLFMSQPAASLKTRLQELGSTIIPPREEIADIWRIFRNYG